MKIAISLITLALTCLITSCGIKEEASNTPIGSVFSGETSDTKSYIKRVEHDNKTLDRETWRPQSKDSF